MVSPMLLVQWLESKVFKQREWMDCFDTYVVVVRITSIRVLIALVVAKTMSNIHIHITRL